MNPIYGALTPEVALELEPLSRLVYEARENRRQVLDAVGASDEASLLARIAAAEIGEHPAYEHYLAAAFLPTPTRPHARQWRRFCTRSMADGSACTHSRMHRT